jgi:hypothetical protein
MKGKYLYCIMMTVRENSVVDEESAQQMKDNVCKTKYSQLWTG